MQDARLPFTVVGLGGSVTQGEGASRPGQGWLAQLEARMRPFLNRDLKVIPAAASHPSALERVPKDVIAHRPDLVLVCYGLDDMRLGTPVDVFAEDLGEVLTQLRDSLPSCQFLLTNVIHMTGWGRHDPSNHGSKESTRAYNLAIEKLAVRNHAMLADVHGAMGERDFLVHPDGVHPNDLGHAVIAGKVFETLVKSLPVFRGNAVNRQGAKAPNTQA